MNTKKFVDTVQTIAGGVALAELLLIIAFIWAPSLTIVKIAMTGCVVIFILLILSKANKEP